MGAFPKLLCWRSNVIRIWKWGAGEIIRLWRWTPIQNSCSQHIKEGSNSLFLSLSPSLIVLCEDTLKRELSINKKKVLHQNLTLDVDFSFPKLRPVRLFIKQTIGGHWLRQLKWSKSAMGIHSAPPLRVMSIVVSTYLVVIHPLAFLAWLLSIAPPNIPASLGAPSAAMIILLSLHETGVNPLSLRCWLEKAWEDVK